MSKFITKALVVAPHQNLRDFICEKVRELGYDMSLLDDDESKVLFIKNGSFGCLNYIWDGFIDCDEYTSNKEEAVALFLELAKMRSDTDKNQWFITEEDQAWANQGIYCPKGSFYKCLIEDRYMGQDRQFTNNIAPAHKATPIELAEAVKQGKIKLI